MKKIWQLLSGNKTTIGMIIVLAAQGLKLFAPDLLTGEQYNFIESAGLAIGGVGLAHKGVKAKINYSISKANKK